MYNMLNSTKDTTQPCFTPLATENQSDNPSLTHTLLRTLEYFVLEQFWRQLFWSGMAIVMSGCTRLYKVESLGWLKTSSYPTDSFQRRQCKYTDFDSIHYKSRWYQSLALSAKSCVCRNDLSFKKCVPWGDQEFIHLLLLPLLCNKTSFCVILGPKFHQVGLWLAPHPLISKLAMVRPLW